MPDDSRTEIGEALQRHLASGEWDGSTLRVRHGNLVVTLDVHAELAGKASSVETRLRAAYEATCEFRCRLRRQHVLDELAAFFGAQDVEIGDPDFDAAFRIESNRPDDVRRWFADAALRAALVASPVETVDVRDDDGWFGAEFPDGADELRFVVPGRITDPAALADLYVVFASALGALCALRLADDDAPSLQL